MWTIVANYTKNIKEEYIFIVILPFQYVRIFIT
jgi:hypothetical protein